MNKRSFLKKSCIGGIWTAPVLQTFSIPAHAQTSPFSCNIVRGTFDFTDDEFSGEFIINSNGTFTIIADNSLMLVENEQIIFDGTTDYDGGYGTYSFNASTGITDGTSVLNIVLSDGTINLNEENSSVSGDVKIELLLNGDTVNNSNNSNLPFIGNITSCTT